MANAFGIIAALLLAVAAFFGYKNKLALAEQRGTRESEQSRLTINEDAFAERSEELVALQDATKAANTENAELTEKLDAQLATNQGLESDISDKKSAAETKKGQVDEGREKLKGFGNLDELEDKLEKLGVDLATVHGELLLRDNEIASRRTLSQSLQTENSALEDVLQRYATKKSLPNLNARVSRVITDYDFVILSGGDNAGIIRDSILNVERDGATIGKLKVTATEPSSAAASMIPDSFQDGTRVRVGDKVVASN